MPLRFDAQAPKNARARIASHLQADLPVATKSGLRILGGQMGLQVTDGMQVWQLGLDQAEQRALHEARAQDWTYLVTEGFKPIAEATLSTAAGAEDVSAMTYGPATDNLVRALSLAETLPEVAEHAYVPRLLLSPALGFWALWLHGTEAPSVFIPVQTGHVSVPALEPMGSADLQAAMQEAAVAVRASMEAAPGPSGGAGGPAVAAGEESPTMPAWMTLTSIDLLAPPLGGAAGVSLPPFMQPQQQSNWCWSAVGTSVGLLFKTGAWTQCQTATGCLPGEDCCKAAGPCNVYGYLDKALAFTKSFDHMVGGTVSTATITAELSSGEPVGTRVAWTGGGAHFMTITGINGASITIQDPIFGTTTMPFKDYASKYKTGGAWTHTYFTKK